MIKNTLYFYRYKVLNSVKLIEARIPINIEIFKPSLLKLKAHSGRLLIYIFWYIFTMGRYQIFYARDIKGSMIHYSHILPKFFKFPFMNKNDLEIGPCWTSENFRGMNIYPAVLTYILKNLSKKNRTFYIMTDCDNLASKKGIEKAGFILHAVGGKRGLLGKYYTNEFIS